MDNATDFSYNALSKVEPACASQYSKGAGVIAIEFCGCKGQNDFIKDYFTNVAQINGNPEVNGCASAVWIALQRRTDAKLKLPFGITIPVFGDGLPLPPTFLAAALTNDHFGKRDNRPMSSCGKDKGSRANVRIVRRP